MSVVRPATHASPVLQDHHQMMMRGKGSGGVLGTISVETLLDADEGFLHDGTLTVGVHISVNAQVLLSFFMLCSDLLSQLSLMSAWLGIPGNSLR